MPLECGKRGTLPDTIDNRLHAGKDNGRFADFFVHCGIMLMAERDSNIVNRLNSIQKLAISIVAGILAYFIFLLAHARILPHLIFAWDIFALVLVILTGITFYTTSPKGIRKQARRQDDHSLVIFFIMLTAACISMLAVIMLLISKSEGTAAKAWQLPIGMGCMVLSWFIVHTLFTSRYAHMYYSDHKTKADTYAGGLDFPKEDEPDFVDFAYFSFTIGMTFQVSDVEISSRKIRRLALWHGLISFSYNAAVIALMVNIIAGLMQ
jgi:uncharacterized membrane protein